MLCICLQIAFNITTAEHTLQIMILLLLIVLAIPHVVLIIYYGIKLALWAHSQYQMLDDPQSGDDEGFKKCTSESHLLP